MQRYKEYSTIPKVSTIYFKQTTQIFLARFECFGTGFARIGTGSHIKQKPEGISFGQTINNKYEPQTALVKNLNLETPYLSAIVHNPADIFIANFYPHNEFLAILPRPLLRPSGEAVTILIGRTITPSFVSVPFEVLRQKVEL